MSCSRGHYFLLHVRVTSGRILTLTVRLHLLHQRKKKNALCRCLGPAAVRLTDVLPCAVERQCSAVHRTNIVLSSKRFSEKWAYQTLRYFQMFFVSILICQRIFISGGNTTGKWNYSQRQHKRWHSKYGFYRKNVMFCDLNVWYNLQSRRSWGFKLQLQSESCYGSRWLAAVCGICYFGVGVCFLGCDVMLCSLWGNKLAISWFSSKMAVAGLSHIPVPVCQTSQFYVP
jgi:hypothetical protein